MKKSIVLIFALCLAVAIPANAQVDFGVKAGTNMVDKPSGNFGSYTKADGYTGFYAGVMAKFTLPIVGLGIEADLLYSQSGSEIGGENVIKQSVEIPVYLRCDLALPLVSNVVVPFVAAGPQFGYAFGNLTEALDYGKYEYNKSQLSFNLGAGLVLLNHLQAHLNYNIALGNTAEYTDESMLGTAGKLITKSKTNTWQISVAYLF